MGSCSSKPPTQSACIREVQLTRPDDLLDVRVCFSNEYDMHLYVRNRSFWRVGIPDDVPHHIRSLKDIDTDESFMHTDSFTTQCSNKKLLQKLWPGESTWFNLGSLHKNWNLPADYKGTLQIFFVIPVWRPFHKAYTKVKRRILFAVM